MKSVDLGAQSDYLRVRDVRHSIRSSFFAVSVF